MLRVFGGGAVGALSHRDFIVLHRLFAVRCHRVQWSRGALYYAVSIRLFHDSLSHRIRDCFSWLRTRGRGGGAQVEQPVGLSLEVFSKPQ